ncbi:MULTISPECIES: ankyrin repeat domain-containing protein [Cupriavidus]
MTPSTDTAPAVAGRALQPAPQAAGDGAPPVIPAALATWLAYHDFPDLRARGANGDTPLMRAAWRGEDAVAEALLAYGAPPDTVNDDGNNALWFACQQGNPVTILRLIQAGTPLDHANDDDITCLMQAAASGRLEVLQILLAHGASASLYAPDGRNALDMAAERGLQLLRAARRMAVPGLDAALREA